MNSKSGENDRGNTLGQTDYRSFSFKGNSKDPLNIRVYREIGLKRPHSLPHSFMRKYSTGIYQGFDTRKKKWGQLTESERAEALKKDWYVRWSFRDPEGNMKRQKNIYAYANHYKKRNERLEILKEIEKSLRSVLGNGYNPYKQEFETSKTSIIIVPDAFEFALNIKKRHMKPESFTRFKSDVNKFLNWLKKNHHAYKPISTIEKKVVNDYLNEMLDSVTKRTRNNYRTNISTIWETFVDEGLVERNIVKGIKMLKANPKRNKAWTDAEANMIFNAVDERMLLILQLIGYCFLRPKEVCRLRVADFNLEDGTFSVMVKAGYVQTKIIPEIMLKNLPDLNVDKSLNIIGRTGILEKWDISDEAKRGAISRDFKKIKDKFGFGEEYGLYSFRHYYSVKLYRSLREKMSPFEAKSNMMQITGHSTMKALEKYLREIGAEIADDYSNLIL